MGPIDFYTCAQVVRLLDDYVDRELTPHEIEQVERHLMTCEHCAREVRLEAGVLTSIRATLRRIQLPPGAEARVWRALAREQRDRLERLAPSPLEHREGTERTALPPGREPSPPSGH